MAVGTTLRNVARLEKQGKVRVAVEICEEYLSRFPGNLRVQKRLKGLQEHQRPAQEAPINLLKELERMFCAGAYDALIGQLSDFINQYPNSYFLWNLLGNAQLKQLAPAAAERAFLQAIEIAPERANAFVGLGDVYKSRHDEGLAVLFYLDALKHEPNNLTALNNLGTLHTTAGKFTEAIQILTRAHKIAPQNHVLLVNLSAAYRGLKAFAQSEQCLLQALAIAPEFAAAHYDLGLLQGLQGRLREAVQSHEAVLATDPTHACARLEKIHQMMHMCDWRAFDEAAQLPDGFGLDGVVPPPFAFLALEDHPARQRKRSEKYAQQLGRPVAMSDVRKPKTSEKRLKIGYFSADFHSHATMHLMGGLFDQHDRSAFEIFAYSFGPVVQDQDRLRIAAQTDAFREVGHLSAAKVAELARKDDLDIAIDLKGYTGNNRVDIFLQRPAPIQIAWLGYPGTMGCGAFDYVIADRVVLPAEHRNGFSENVVYMPGSYQVNDNKRQISPKQFTRADCGLPETGFVFCCFNNSYKITPDVFDIWMRVLSQCEGSVLWLLESNGWAQENLKREAKARGVCPSRLIFAPRMPVAEHLARHRLADLFLDTFNYNAHTTASDALWVGVPVVSMAGRQFSARVAASLLHAVGLPDLVTNDAEAYEALALQFAKQPKELSEIKGKLARNRAVCPLFDTGAFTQHLETAYRTLQEGHCNGHPLSDLHIHHGITAPTIPECHVFMAPGVFAQNGAPMEHPAR